MSTSHAPHGQDVCSRAEVGIREEKGDMHMRGGQAAAATLRFGVKGSGRRMLRGKAERMRLRIWMQLGGMTSQKAKW